MNVWIAHATNWQAAKIPSEATNALATLDTKAMAKTNAEVRESRSHHF